MLRILMNAYAVSPGMGSEPGMGWNWCVNLARHSELHIITEGEFRPQIEATVPILEQGRNMHFYYNPVTEKVRRMCWNQGDWRFYHYYKRWQKKTAEMAREICKRERIDILHQQAGKRCLHIWPIFSIRGLSFISIWGTRKNIGSHT